MNVHSISQRRLFENYGVTPPVAPRCYSSKANVTSFAATHFRGNSMFNMDRYLSDVSRLGGDGRHFGHRSSDHMDMSSPLRKNPLKILGSSIYDQVKTVGNQAKIDGGSVCYQVKIVGGFVGSKSQVGSTNHRGREFSLWDVIFDKIMEFMEQPELKSSQSSKNGKKTKNGGFPMFAAVDCQVQGNLGESWMNGRFSVYDGEVSCCSTICSKNSPGGHTCQPLLTTQYKASSASDEPIDRTHTALSQTQPNDFIEGSSESLSNSEQNYSKGGASARSSAESGIDNSSHPAYNLTSSKCAPEALCNGNLNLDDSGCEGPALVESFTDVHCSPPRSTFLHAGSTSERPTSNEGAHESDFLRSSWNSQESSLNGRSTSLLKMPLNDLTSRDTPLAIEPAFGGNSSTHLDASSTVLIAQDVESEDDGSSTDFFSSTCNGHANSESFAGPHRPTHIERSYSECSAASDDSFIVFEDDAADCPDDDTLIFFNESEDDATSDEDCDEIDHCVLLPHNWEVPHYQPYWSKLDEANQKWNSFYGNLKLHDATEVVPKKVRFAEGENLVRVKRLVAWDFAHRAARVGPWEMYYRDSERFKAKIIALSPVISPVLSVNHRKSVYAERFQTS